MPSDCKQPFNQLKIQMDGNVYACSQGQLVGNINRQVIEEIWNGKKILELRKRLNEDNYDAMCLNCPLYDNSRTSRAIKTPSTYSHIQKIEGKYFNSSTELKIKNTSIYHLDSVVLDKKESRILGWAIDAENNKCVDHIAMLVNGVLAVTADLLVAREDVASALKNKNLINSGFVIEHDAVSIEKKIELILISNDYIISIINVR